MTEHDEVNKRITSLEESQAWLKDRVWNGVGNLHDRVHNLEDRSADRSFDIEKIKEDIKTVKSVVGLEGYGGRNLMNDLRDALERINDMTDTITNLKGNVITTKDFQTLLTDVKTLKERGQAQITFSDKVLFIVLSAVINFGIVWMLTRVFAP